MSVRDFYENKSYLGTGTPFVKDKCLETIQGQRQKK